VRVVSWSTFALGAVLWVAVAAVVGYFGTSLVDPQTWREARGPWGGPTALGMLAYTVIGVAVIGTTGLVGMGLGTSGMFAGHVRRGDDQSVAPVVVNGVMGLFSAAALLFALGVTLIGIVTFAILTSRL